LLSAFHSCQHLNDAINLTAPRWRQPMDLETIRQLGFPAAILIVFGLAVWRVLVWVGNKIALPVAEAHIQFLKILGDQSEKQTQHLDAIATKTEALAEDHSQFLVELTKLSVAIREGQKT
jgi:hypothetical protein